MWPAPPQPVLIAFCLCMLGLGACGLQGLQPTVWAIFWHTHDNSFLHSSITPAHSKSPFACVLLTHDLHSYSVIHPNMSPQVVQPIKVAASYRKYTKILYQHIHLLHNQRTISLTRHGIQSAHSRCSPPHYVVHVVSVHFAKYYTPQR